MAAYHKMDKFVVTEYRDGCIFKTKNVGSQWFLMSECPECYVDQGGFMWVNTDDYYFGPNDPRKENANGQ